MVIWDREGYFNEADRQYNDSKIYRDIKYTKNTLSSPWIKVIRYFYLKVYLKRNRYQKKTWILYYNNKNATNLGKLYFLPKTHKRLFNVPGRPVIWNYGTPTEKVSEYLDFCLKPIMQNGWSHVKDSSDFKDKIKKLGKLSENITLVIADVVVLYPILYLETLRERLFKSEDLKLPVNDIVKMAEFVLKNNIFEFNGKVKQQIAGTTIELILNLLPLMHAFTWMR